MGVIFSKLVYLEQVLQSFVILCKYESKHLLKLINLVARVKLNQLDVLVVLIGLANLTDVKVTKPFSKRGPISFFPIFCNVIVVEQMVKQFSWIFNLSLVCSSVS